MKYLIICSLIFILGGTLGYLIELIFRRIVHKKWVNPGFLTGPCLPLYGVGTLCLFLISSLDYSFISSPVWRAVFVIAIITAAMTLVEYITGLIFIKGMNIKLWDYSDRWGNIQGIICPLFTLFWGIIGAVYYLFLHKFFVGAAEWLGENPWFSFGVGIYLGIFIVDIFYSFRVVAKIRMWAKEKNVVVRYEAFKLSAAKKAQEIKEKFNFFFGLHNKKDLNGDLENYVGDEHKKADA
mgnify:FL=1|jgi:uncharacterized membrane protein